MPVIRTVTVEPVRVSFAEAVLTVRAVLDGPAEGGELRGRLVGPRCEGVSTVEIAYPLRPSDDPLSLRAVIPEPNPWAPAAPFRYDGRIELWVDGEKADEKEFVVELRAAGDASAKRR